jgi:hypothetical protein
VHRHFLRGPSGAIGSITTRTRIPEVSEPGPPCSWWWRGCPGPRRRGRAAGPGRRTGPPGPAGGSPPGRAGAAVVSGPARRAGAEEGAGRRAAHRRNTAGGRLKNGYIF